MDLKIKEIFDKLQDEESRMIFIQRLQFYLDGDYNHIFSMLVNLGYYNDIGKYVGKINGRPLGDLMERFKKDSRPVVIYGAGTYSDWTILLLRYYGIKIECLCDRNPEFTGVEKLGLKIISPEELISDYKNAYIVISAISDVFVLEICCILKENGFKEECIFELGHIHDKNQQYFGLEEFKHVSDEVYVDAGCLNGETILQFIKFCGGKYKKIYGMEPEPKNYKTTLNCIRDNKLENTVIANKGAWSCKDVLKFINNRAGSSRIDDNGSIEVPVISIDEMVGEDAVTFIKMDIEGAELEALKGAQNSIKNHKPKLAICLYHKPEDILTIPIYINSLVSDYKFYIRHHSSLTIETVLYAVPPRTKEEEYAK